MDFKNSPNKHTTTNSQNHHLTPSKSDLLSSAKLVAEAAQSTLRHQSNKVDKAKVAAAAADLLNAASSYGKLDQKGLGTYLEKAEDYLRHYNSSTAPAHSPAHSGGADQFMKMAEGFLKKH